MSSTTNDDPSMSPSDAPQQPSRRRALQSAIRFTTVMSTIGLSAGMVLTGKKAHAQVNGGTGGADGLKQLVNHAIANEDMDAAIELYGAESGLSAESLDALRTITPDDLQAVNALSASVTGAVGDSNITAETYCDVIVHVDDIA